MDSFQPFQNANSFLDVFPFSSYREKQPGCLETFLLLVQKWLQGKHLQKQAWAGLAPSDSYNSIYDSISNWIQA